MNKFSLQRFISELEPLINIDSGFGAPEGATEVALRLAAPLVDAGWILERHKLDPACGECVIVKNREADHYDLMLVGHTDTVFPAGETGRRPFRVDDKRAYGVGVIDMKQGCLAMVHVMQALDQRTLDTLNIALIFNPDEEIGSPYSRELIDSYARRCDVALVYEAASAEDGSVRCIQRKGSIGRHLEFHGRAGHAGYAFENGGINAVKEMAHWITRLDLLHDKQTGTTVNPGVARGGQAPNIIPDFAELKLDIRFETLAEMERVQQALEELERHARDNGVGFVYTKTKQTMPLEPSEKTEALCDLARKVAGEMGFGFGLKKRGGLSDANHIGPCGPATMDGMGPTGDHDHDPREYLELSTVLPNLEFSRRLILALAEQKEGGSR